MTQPGFRLGHLEGLKAPRSTSLSPLEEAAAVTFRQKTRLPLDDCLHALQRKLPSLTRSSLYQLYQRQGISQFLRAGDQQRENQPFKRYLLNDIREIHTSEGKPTCLSVAVDRASRSFHA